MARLYQSRQYVNEGEDNERTQFTVLRGAEKRSSMSRAAGVKADTNHAQYARVSQAFVSW